MKPAHFGHRRHQMIDGLGDAGAGLVRRSLAAGPDIRRVFDLAYVLAKLCDGPLPKHAVAAFVKEMLAVLGKGTIELLGPHLPHLFHRILPLLAELKPRGSVLYAGKKPPLT